MTYDIIYSLLVLIEELILRVYFLNLYKPRVILKTTAKNDNLK